MLPRSHRDLIGRGRVPSYSLQLRDADHRTPPTPRAKCAGRSDSVQCIRPPEGTLLRSGSLMLVSGQAAGPYCASGARSRAAPPSRPSQKKRSLLGRLWDIGAPFQPITNTDAEFAGPGALKPLGPVEAELRPPCPVQSSTYYLDDFRLKKIYLTGNNRQWPTTPPDEMLVIDVLLVEVMASADRQIGRRD
jgi:hypothetical protein